MARTIMGVSGCCAVVMAGFLATGDAPVSDRGRSPLTIAAQVETETDFTELRAQAEAAIRALIETSAANGAT